MRRSALAGVGLLLTIAFPVAGQRNDGDTRHVLIVTGASGEAAYAERFEKQAIALLDALRGPLKLPADRVRWLAEDPARQPARIAGKSTREVVGAAVAAIAARARPGDVVAIFLIGHGSASTEPRFNLPGPDVTAAEMAGMLRALEGQTVVFVNAASASGDFVGALSGPNRIVITATKTGFERNETFFGDGLVKALAEPGADTDKNGQVSLLEAFNYATRETARLYESTNRLRTEHALLDDNGDGKGSTDPDPDKGDGALARRVSLAPPVLAVAGGDSGLRVLAAERDSLERAVESLRREKDKLPEAEYQRRLEDLLVKLAETSRQIRERSGQAKP